MKLPPMLRPLVLSAVAQPVGHLAPVYGGV